MPAPADLRCPVCQGASFEPGPTAEWSLTLPTFGRAKRAPRQAICRGCNLVLTFADPL